MSEIFSSAGRRRLIASLARRAQRRYFVGPELQDALRAHHRFQSMDIASTLGYWDGSGDTATGIVDVYHQAVDAIARDKADSYVSIKPWAFAFDSELFREIALHGRERRVLIHLDSLEWVWAEKHLAFIEQYTDIVMGCTLPGRWRRSAEDATRLARLASHVRVVKGQCSPPPDEAVEPERGFEAVVTRLADGTAPIRIATHDHVLAKRVFHLLRGRPNVELELLYGLPLRKVMPLAKEFDRPVRIYVPFGYGYLPYSLDALKRSPRIAWWLLKDAMTFGTSPLESKL